MVVAALIGALGLGLVGPVAQASAGSRTTPTAASGTPLHWHRCTGRAGTEAVGGVRCATLQVPLDYNDPTGRTITLALSRSRHRSSAAAYKGIILVNFGGPGAPGLAGAALQDDVPGGVGEDYDWIGWDPRGVGASRPAMSCRHGYFRAPRRSYVPTTQSLLDYWLHRSKSYADACAAKYPHLIQHMTTADSARDMESIRQALGRSRISYYGYSYGTYLGQVYSTLFPDHLHRMVLDSNVDPRRVWYGANLDQDRAFDRNIGRWFGWVAKWRSVYHLGHTARAVRHRYYTDLARLVKHPVGKLGPAEWVDAFTGAAYYRSTWLDIAHDWRAFVRHRSTAGLLADYRDSDDPGDDNGFAVYNAVQCTDAPWPTDWARWQQDNDRLYRTHPFLTWSNAWYNSPCLYWGAPAGTPVTIDGSRTASALLIDQTLDAATPYSGSLEVRRRYPNSRLLAEPGGTTHADSLNGNACVDRTVASYLRSGKLPKRRSGDRADATCRPGPPPNPRKDSIRLAPAYTVQAHSAGAGTTR